MGIKGSEDFDRVGSNYKKIDKLDQLLLFVTSSAGIFISVLQELSVTNVLDTHLFALLFFGWLMPIYIGYYRGAVKYNDALERSRGWIYFLIGLIGYFILISMNKLVEFLNITIVSKTFSLKIFIFLPVFIFMWYVSSFIFGIPSVSTFPIDFPKKGGIWILNRIFTLHNKNPSKKDKKKAKYTSISILFVIVVIVTIKNIIFIIICICIALIVEFLFTRKDPAKNKVKKILELIRIDLYKNKIYYLRDFTTIVSVPIILTLLLLKLPQTFQNSLALHYENPIFYQFFSANFIHSSFQHLLNNITSYMVTILLIYFLFLIIDKIEFFYLTFFVIIILIPTLIQFTNFLVIEFNGISFGTSRGFSAINGAFIGVLPLSIIYYVKDKFKFKNFNFFNYSFGLFALGFVITLSHGLLYLISINVNFLLDDFLINQGQLIFWWIITTVLFVIFMKYQVLGIEDESSKSIIYYLIFSLLLFTYLTFSLFPTRLIVKGHFINFSSHWIGYMLGFLGSLTSIGLWDYYNKDRNRNN